MGDSTLDVNDDEKKTASQSHHSTSSTFLWCRSCAGDHFLNLDLLLLLTKQEHMQTMQTMPRKSQRSPRCSSTLSPPFSTQSVKAPRRTPGSRPPTAARPPGAGHLHPLPWLHPDGHGRRAGGEPGMRWWAFQCILMSS